MRKAYKAVAHGPYAVQKAFPTTGSCVLKGGPALLRRRRGLAPDLGFDLLLVTLNAGRKAKIVLTWGA